jgi:hypothetical protein
MGGELAKSSKPREERHHEMKPFAAHLAQAAPRAPLRARGVSKPKRCILHITSRARGRRTLAAWVGYYGVSVFSFPFHLSVFFDTLHDVTKNMF